ncbi:MAG: hypothetical protein DRP56_06705 [Planctomycetota bacterium]|nr:MAG: hypothetical protein DRP56_06705 [Planctomycetota bacterium]RKY10859.1 MAG: hypothetical protein DRP52_06760 [Planctomycetota bacterium]
MDGIDKKQGGETTLRSLITNALSDPQRIADLLCAILVDSDENELFTTTNPGQIQVIEPTDDITGAVKMIDIVHSEIHEGEYFTVAFADESVADDGFIRLRFTTGATKYPHFSFVATMGGDARAKLIENVTISAGGTTVTAINNKRTSSETAEVVVRHTATYTGGTIIDDFIIPGGTNNRAAGGKTREVEEWLLKQSTEYILEIRNISGVTNPGCLIAGWYEESNH